MNSEKIKKALRIAVNVGCGFEGDAEDAVSLLGLIEANESRIAELEGEIAKMKKYFHKPAHGTCCTCQKCGHTYDECRCDFDEALDDLDKANARIAELELGLNNQTVHSNTLQKILTKKLDRIAELEHDLTNKEIEYTDLWDDALAFQARIAELKELLDTESQLSNQFYLLLVDNPKSKKLADDLIEALRINGKEVQE